MTLTRLWTAITILALAALATHPLGCSDFSQHRMGGVRELRDTSKPDTKDALAISNPPQKKNDDKIQQAKFTPVQAPNPLTVLHQRAAKQHAGMDSYIYRMKRREGANGSKQPEELVLVKLRREPYSVALKFLGEEGKGREVVFVKGKFKDEMQVRMAAGDIPFVPAGKVMSFSPDSALVKARSRRPITETGFGFLIERFGQVAAAVEKDDPRNGVVKYLGQVKRPEFDAAVEAVSHELPPRPRDAAAQGGQTLVLL